MVSATGWLKVCKVEGATTSPRGRGETYLESRGYNLNLPDPPHYKANSALKLELYQYVLHNIA